MKTVTYEVPAMYGDHHVQEVIRILMEKPGVEDVYASSAFQMVEIQYDPKKLKEDEIESLLDESGYLGEFDFPTETDAATYLEADRSESFFRHTEVYETNREVVGFVQKVSYTGRPLWSCPGFGVIKDRMED